ncbi:MAG: hypothetical protein KAW56_11225 [Candidatus Marinimicrobia bacterium]|nr:hypothetical protein [Candidatus Neomarinimicrobiota bacterium]MCK4447636.1 hypothetical protein [Candidatus Neomarinimicrobiota bacterium]
MSFVGNINGPKKSKIVAMLGHEYFGITLDELNIEIQIYENEESQGEVDPVYVDRSGKFFLLFNAPWGKTQRFYLKDHSYKLSGKVFSISEEGDIINK